MTSSMDNKRQVMELAMHPCRPARHTDVQSVSDDVLHGILAQLTSAAPVVTPEQQMDINRSRYMQVLQSAKLLLNKVS